MLYKLSCILLVYILAMACGNSKIIMLNKHEETLIDSLVLLKSLPVYLDTLPAGFKLELRQLLLDSLISIGYTVITTEKNKELQMQYMKDLIAPKDQVKFEGTLKEATKDKNYFVKQTERAKPFCQKITIVPCVILSDTCFVLKRVNLPHTLKEKSWVFEFKSNQSENTLVHQIIKTLLVEN